MGKSISLNQWNIAALWKPHSPQYSGIFISKENSKKKSSKTSCNQNCFSKGFLNIIISFNLKRNISAVLRKSFPSLLLSYLDHILRIYCYAFYKTKYLIFRYISRDAICFYVSMTRLLTQKVTCPWEHKNCLTESDPKPIQSST